ncbi:sensor histidine kinase [Haloimpatiens sp. FM7315]|uniref:sensor histidine kinase n=1 Tax=Haloimpatiens sp. FM7315 TaxID=3298609 RepID=UPI0035A28D1D
MKRKRINYYILFFLIFIAVMIYIDFSFEGILGEYFEKQILFNREKVNFLGMEHTKGVFYWPKLKDILIRLTVICIVLLEVITYFTAQRARKDEEKRLINKIETRIDLLAKGEIPEKDEKLKLIDSKIRDVIHEKDIIKKEALVEINKKNDLVTYLAHDLKTPLASIIGYLSILDESKVPEDIRKDYIKKLLKKSYRLEDLTNQFFDITRFNLQEIPLNKTSLDAVFFLEQLTEELYPLLKKKNLKFDIEVPKDMKIYVDGVLFARVLNNLLKNAIAYSNKDSVIKIRGKAEDSITELFIENDGDVISDEELKLIFQKFYRRDKSRSQSAGAGLGLAIAKQIVEKHKGSIKASSKEGHTMFIITLPNS